MSSLLAFCLFCEFIFSLDVYLVIVCTTSLYVSGSLPKLLQLDNESQKSVCVQWAKEVGKAALKRDIVP